MLQRPLQDIVFGSGFLATGIGHAVRDMADPFLSRLSCRYFGIRFWMPDVMLK